VRGKINRLMGDLIEKADLIGAAAFIGRLTGVEMGRLIMNAGRYGYNQIGFSQRL
jgi:hypothetical protein